MRAESRPYRAAYGRNFAGNTKSALRGRFAYAYFARVNGVKLSVIAFADIGHNYVRAALQRKRSSVWC
jgi:hypothetical protein